ncbi:MAG: hypothetical protein ACTSYJ_03610 [Candidatus Thorarchaeota archaeon]
MPDSVCTYAFVTALYDKCHSVLETFIPLVVRTTERDREYSTEKIQRLVAAKYSITVPSHVLDSILSSAKRKGFIDRNTNKKIWRLTKSGEEYSDSLESEIDVTKRIEAMLSDAGKYFRTEECIKSKEEIYHLICGIAEENASVLEIYLKRNISEVSYHDGTKEREVLIKYIRQAAKEHYNSIYDIIYGGLLVCIVHSNDPTTLNDLQKRKFKDTKVYFDTNLVLALLKFKPKRYTKAAEELLQLLKEFKLELKVFDFTVLEISSLLNQCLRHLDEDVNSSLRELIGEFRRQGITRTKLLKIIGSIEARLAKLGIEIEPTRVQSLKLYELKNPLFKRAIERAKPEQHKMNRNHDIAAVEYIYSKRGHHSVSIEDVNSIFLTSDRRLAFGIHDTMGHDERGTVSEVILDRLLTNLLWIKKPDWEFPLESVIAAHSVGLFARRSVWDRFTDTLQKMKEDGKIEEEDITDLFYQDYIENELAKDTELEETEIDEEFIESHISAAREKRKSDLQSIRDEKERAVKTEVERIESDYSDRLNSATEKLEEKWLNTIDDKRCEARQKSGEWAEKRYNWMIVILIILGLGGASQLYGILEEKGVNGNWAFLLTVFAVMWAIFAPKLGIKEKIIVKWTEWKYNRLVKYLPEPPSDSKDK